MDQNPYNPPSDTPNLIQQPPESLKFQVSLTASDMAALTIAVMTKGSGGMVIRLLYAILAASFLLFAVWWLSTHADSPPLSIVPGLAIALCLGFFVFWRSGRNAGTLVTSMFSKGDYPGTLGTFEVAIGPGGISQSNRFSEHRHSWKATMQLTRTATHISVLTSPAGGFIIPKQSLAGAHFEQVWNTISALFNANGRETSHNSM